MDRTVLEDQDVAYEVELRFRPGGPAILGVWSNPETADVKFTKWLGSHGRDDAVLTATADGETRPVKHWTAKGGPQVAGVA
ncbi:hypothetical protein [Streptomyces sp. NPDC058861]|uniref:hypothetical protein n=1 Tax=Streptomyces sp. NPDC058861 TaxID=3346653 RepID=UPI0036BEDAEB